jgi:hypothetical protein
MLGILRRNGDNGIALQRRLVMSSRSRSVLAWLASLLAVALVVGSAWLLFGMFRPPARQVTVVTVDDAALARSRANLRPRRAPEAPRWFQAAAQRWSDDDAPDGVRQLLGTYWRIKSADMIMEVEKPAGETAISFRYLAPVFAPPEIATTLDIARAGRSARPRGIPDLTPQQVQQLRALTLPEGAIVSPEHQRQALRLWDGYESAAEAGREAAEKDLLAGLAKISADSAQPTRQAYLAFAEQVRSILTAPQIEAFSKTGRPAR